MHRYERRSPDIRWFQLFRGIAIEFTFRIKDLRMLAYYLSVFVLGVHEIQKLVLGAALLVAFLVFYQLAPGAMAEKSDLNRIVAAHRSHRERIVTFSAQLSFEATTSDDKGRRSPPDQCTGRFWLSPAGMRFKCSEHGKTWDYVAVRSVRTTIVYRPTGEVGVTRMLMSDRHWHRCDPFARGLLALNLPGTIRYLYLEDLLPYSGSSPKVVEEIIGGEPLVRIDLQFNLSDQNAGKWFMSVWLDKQRNYVINRVVYRGDVAGNAIDREEWVDKLTEIVPGIFFPTEISARSGQNGQWITTRNTIISQIRINEPIADGMFIQTFPHGIVMLDSVTGASYRVDQNGSRIGEKTPLGGFPPPSLAGGAVVVGKASDSEERNGHYAIIMAGVALIVVGSGFAMARYIRRS
jgi:hypothetical protein